MQLIDLLSPIGRLALEAMIPGVVLGTLLVALVSLVLRMIMPLNAATRAMVWTMTLAALAVIPAIEIAIHAPVASAPRPAAITSVPAAPSEFAETVEPQRPSAASAVVSTETPTRPLSIPLPQMMPAVALCAYAVIVGLLLLRLLVSYLRVCLLRKRTRPAPASLETRLEAWRARCPTNRRVGLRLCDAARSPLATGFLRPMIVMPAALMLELSEEEFDDLGVHELAHVRRYDDWFNLFQQVLQAFFFFHPAVHWVGRKLNLEREVACDDWVISTNRTKAYARCLTKVIELRHWQRGAVLTSGAFFGKRQIFKRVEILLDKTRNAATRVSLLTIIGVVVVLVGVSLEVAHLPAVIAITQDNGISRTSSRWKDDVHDLKVDIRGEMTFSADERSVATLSPEGSVDIAERKGWAWRRLEVRPSTSGAPVVKYFVDGRQKPLDSIGQAWATETFQFLIREMAIDVEGRVARMLKKSGVEGVLEETKLIRSDNSKIQYLNQLLEQATLNTEQLQRLAGCVKKISSDNDKAEFLLANANRFAAEPLRASYFRAVDSISSDNDRRRVLVAALAADRSPETARLAGLSAKSMSSDNDKAEVLLAVSPAAMKTGCSAIEAVRTMQSDSDKARVLRSAGFADATECRALYFDAVNTIQSDNDRAAVLNDVLQRPAVGAASYASIANSAKAMSSDNDKAAILTSLSKFSSDAAFFEAVHTISSDNDRKNVLTAVLQQPPAKAALLSVVESASQMSSDNDKAEILVAAAKLSTDAEVRAAIQHACATLSADNDYRRVASILLSEPAESK